MKRFAFVMAASLASISLSTGAAGAATMGPADYRAECETAYQAGKPVFDPLIANAMPVLHPVEAALCGENRHA